MCSSKIISCINKTSGWISHSACTECVAMECADECTLMLIKSSVSFLLGFLNRFMDGSFQSEIMIIQRNLK